MAGFSTKARRSLRAAAVTLALLAAAAAAAQTTACAPLKPSNSQQPAYGPVAGERRCEGFFDRGVSQPFVELVSLTRGVAQLESAGVLRLSAASAMPTRLVIQPLKDSPFYRVDAALDAGSALVWNAAPMLAATGLQADELGFLATAQPPVDTPTRVAPVSLAPQHDASADGYAMLRASVALSSLAWRVYRPGGSEPAGPWRTHAAPPRYAWQPVALRLALPAEDGLRVDVRAFDRQNEPLPMLSFVLVGAKP